MFGFYFSTLQLESNSVCDGTVSTFSYDFEVKTLKCETVFRLRLEQKCQIVEVEDWVENKEDYIRDLLYCQCLFLILVHVKSLK